MLRWREGTCGKVLDALHFMRRLQLRRLCALHQTHEVRASWVFAISRALYPTIRTSVSYRGLSLRWANPLVRRAIVRR